MAKYFFYQTMISGDTHSFGSPEAAATLGDYIQRQFGWRVKMKQFDLEVVLRIVDDKVLGRST